MENIYNNPVTEDTNTPVIEETPAVEETPVVESPVVEEPVVEAPAVEEVTPEPVKAEEEPTAIKTTDFGKSTAEVQGVGPVNNGAIGVTKTPAPVARKSSKKNEEVKEKVAIHSTKNVTWQGVGKVYRGYNIVDKEAADQWLTRSHIRIATPEEVAKEFGK